VRKILNSSLGDCSQFFSIRAKSIKNKAQVNQELSAEELKKLLKKIKSQTVTFQTYISALEGEVKVWRSGTYSKYPIILAQN
jgi:predicted DNA binding CopG/RHH family protein